MESAPRNVQVRPLSSSTMVITWEPPETPNGQVTVSLLFINICSWSVSETLIHSFSHPLTFLSQFECK